MKSIIANLMAALVIILQYPAVVCLQFPLIASQAQDHPRIEWEEIGLNQITLNQTVLEAINSCQIRDLLKGTRHRILSTELLAPDYGLYGSVKSGVEMFRGTVYDYTNGRNIFVRGIPFDPLTYNFEESNIQPYPSSEELLEAAQIAGVSPGESVSGYMPPFITRDFENGTSHRLVHLAISSESSNRTVLVNMINGTVESSLAQEARIMACVAPANAAQASVNRGTPGTSNIKITQNGNVLWTLRVTRPSASSGTNGGGIELNDVKYKGKRVLFKASVPILNVEYENKNTGCGPFYRDWQNQEYPLVCDGTNLTPWLRLCKSPAKTIVDPPNKDGGNFVGVAVYVEGQEVVLKSQMSAGWYRYTSEWRFHVNGTLRPRWGFGGVLSGQNCVCQIHHHHVYWRLDFDIVTAGNNLVREFNNPPIFPNQPYHDKIYEIKRPRDSSHRRHWEISGRTGETYSLNPGPNDGITDDFGAGDVWILKYHADELDDGVGFVRNVGAKANIDKFKNGELVRDTDVVIWYGAHFKHDQNHDDHEGAGHIVGPDIRPVRW